MAPINNDNNNNNSNNNNNNSNNDDNNNNNDNDNNNNDDLREVGVPSRNILHVRGRPSKFRIRVADVGEGGADAQKVS